MDGPLAFVAWWFRLCYVMAVQRPNVEPTAMFELQRLSNGERRGIALATKLGTQIENEIAPSPTEQHRLRFAALMQKHPTWRLRKAPVGGYNCFGHVWASRRTAIYDLAVVRLILAEDGYRITQHPEVDDLVLMVEGSDVFHVGRVAQLKSIAPGSTPVPWMVSKLDDWGGEVIHSAYDHPYDESQGFRIEIQFWTDRSQ